jgi:hypothetical protein
VPNKVIYFIITQVVKKALEDGIAHAQALKRIHLDGMTVAALV